MTSLALVLLAMLMTSFVCTLMYLNASQLPADPGGQDQDGIKGREERETPESEVIIISIGIE